MKRLYIMKRFYMLPVAAFAALVLGSSPVLAEEDAELDAVASEEAEPGDATRELSLPESASDQGRESSARGLDTANQAREKREEFGRETARDARERGRGRDRDDAPGQSDRRNR